MDPIAQAQDDLRREQFMGYLRRFGPYLALALLALIIVVAGREAWQAYDHHVAKSRTDALMAASNENDSVAALLGVAAQDKGARAAIARLIAFQRMSLEEQKTGGLDVLDALRKNKKTPVQWRDFAALTLVRARISFGAGEGEADELLAILGDAATNEDSPWHVPARMEAALIEGEIKGDRAKAAEWIKDLDPQAQMDELSQKLYRLQAHYAESAAGATE